MSTQPGEAPLTRRAPRVVACRKLQQRKHRDAQHQFLLEGPQAIGAMLCRPAHQPGRIISLFVTRAARERYAALVGAAKEHSVEVLLVSDDAIASLSETVTPSGLIAVAQYLDVPLAVALQARPRLMAAAIGISDPGNAGTLIRIADAAGAQAVIFTVDSVDPYNGKCVRASAGSICQLMLVRNAPWEELLKTRMTLLATSGYGATDLFELADQGQLTKPTLWLFGNEAHGLPAEMLAAADAQVAIPIYGEAESLNVATAAAICLYTSARAQRHPRSQD